jgi:hypothetical protein
LKTFDTDIIQHKIPLKVGSKPFRKKIRKFNPLLMSIIEKELKRMLDAKIFILGGQFGADQKMKKVCVD